MKFFFSLLLFVCLITPLSAKKVESFKVNVSKEEITVNDKLVIKSGPAFRK